MPNFQSLTLTPFVLDILMCISPHLFAILDLFLIPSSLQFSLSDSVNSVSRFCFYYLRPTLSNPTITPFACYRLTILVPALICARVDYGNEVYVGLSSTNASKLQFVLNAAVRLIGGISKFSPIASFIKTSFHWLPIRKRN